MSNDSSEKKTDAGEKKTDAGESKPKKADTPKASPKTSSTIKVASRRSLSTTLGVLGPGAEVPADCLHDERRIARLVARGILVRS